MKEAVIITSQEEWDFVSEKLGYKWEVSTFTKCKGNYEEVGINLNELGRASKKYYIKDGYTIYTFNEWLTTRNLQYKNQIGMKEIMLDVLEKTYSNLLLRRKTVPLFMSNPGLGKSTIIREFAESKGVKLVKITLSQRMPNEVTGGVMPDLKKGTWVTLDNEQLASLKDGDILFFDETFNGTLKQTLDAMLNLLEDRMLPSGKKLADVMIVAASNPQGLINLTPQIKQRFDKYDLKFNSKEFQILMEHNYGMTVSISSHLCTLISKEKFENTDWDYMTPRSIEKAIIKIGCDLPSSYDELLLPILSKPVPLNLVPEARKLFKLNKTATEIEYIKLLKLIVQNDKTNKK